MIAKKRKLPLKGHLKFPGRTSAKSRFFTLKEAPNSLPFTRWGVIIGIKNAKKAVIRNRIRRLFFKKAGDSSLFNRSGFDYLGVALPSLKISDSSEWKLAKDDLDRDIGSLLGEKKKI